MKDSKVSLSLCIFEYFSDILKIQVTKRRYKSQVDTDATSGWKMGDK